MLYRPREATLKLRRQAFQHLLQRMDIDLSFSETLCQLASRPCFLSYHIEMI